MMKELTRLYEKNSRFQNSLCSSIECFRNCEDNPGLDNFLNSIDDLESIMDYCQCMGKPEVEIKKMLRYFQKLYIMMQNQDSIGMTDILEFEIYPLSKEWVKGSDEK